MADRKTPAAAPPAEGFRRADQILDALRRRRAEPGADCASECQAIHFEHDEIAERLRRSEREHGGVGFELLFAGTDVDTPEPWKSLPLDQTIERLKTAKARVARDVIVLVHHYQNEAVYSFGDFGGDSFLLARKAASQPDRRYIVFCGVHFMAETARVVCHPDQVVILPSLGAGCSMADMAKPEDAEDAFDALRSLARPGRTVIPITYMNSEAALKALCGRNGGVVFTSSNAETAFRWALARSGDVQLLCTPDEYLGRNVARRLGIRDDEMVTWNWMGHPPLGGCPREALAAARVVLWRGLCHVHDMFEPRHVELFAERLPRATFLLHPEVRPAVVEEAGRQARAGAIAEVRLGSTEAIKKWIEQGNPGDVFVVATEWNLVNRLALDHPDRRVVFMADVLCKCSTMNRITPRGLLWTLETIERKLRGEEVALPNVIDVPMDVRRDANVALQRMLDLPPG